MPAVGDYPFTTHHPTPGMMAFEDIAFQLVDLPPLASQHVEPWVFDLLRHADLIWIVLAQHDALEGFDEVRRLLDSRKIAIGPPVDASASSSSSKSLLVITGTDRPGAAEAVEAFDELLEHRWQLVPVSCKTGAGLDELRRATFEARDIIRVYTKDPGKPRERSTPFTLPRGAAVGDLAERVHKELLTNMKFARVWGASAFDGQAVQRDHILAEGDLVEIHA